VNEVTAARAPAPGSPADSAALALCRLLLALPDLARLGPYWRTLRRLRAEAMRRRAPGVDPGAVLRQGVYVHRGIALALGPGAELRHRVRLGIDEPGLRAGSFSLGAGSVVLSDTHVDCSAAVTVGRGSHIGRRNQIFTHTHDTSRRDVPVLGAPLTTAPVTVGDDVMLYNEVVVLPGVTIGDGAIVAVRAVVTRDVPPYAVVAGIPARIIGERR
jgi:acetyltransferase-like isoleucine patch superfamily enzyme